MVMNQIDETDFSKSITKCAKNSLNFENSSRIENYVNKDLDYFQTSVRSLKLFDVLFITKYRDKLISTAQKIILSEQEQMKYYRNPKYLSYDKFDVIDYWYIILLINNWKSAFEMTDLNHPILIPNASTISEIITQEEFLTNNL